MSDEPTQGLGLPNEHVPHRLPPKDSNGLAVEKPNFIIFMPDQLRYDSVGYTGNEVRTQGLSVNTKVLTVARLSKLPILIDSPGWEHVSRIALRRHLSALNLVAASLQGNILMSVAIVASMICSNHGNQISSAA